MLRFRATLFAVITLMMTAFAFAAPNFPALTGRVVDQAHVLTPDQVTMLSNKLATYEQQSGHQIVIATVSTLGGLDIADYGYQLGRTWGIGQKGKNDGVVVLVAPNEHKTRIEVGYGLEGDLTDATSSFIINQSMVPKFRTGDYVGGLWAGTDNIAKVVGGQGGAIVQAAQQQQQNKAQQGGGRAAAAIPYVIFFLIVMFILFNAFRGRNAYMPMGGSGYRGSGGGFDSGGGGGFSGGGGSFGGGGASGGW